MDTATGRNAVDALEPPTGLWLLALLFFGIGDLITTMLGLTVGSSAEANPLIAMLVDRFGVVVLFPVKMLFLSGCYLGWKHLSIPYPRFVPGVLALLGFVVTLWNTGVLLTGP